MSQNTIAMELVSSYGTYVSVEGLTADALSDAPATTPACIASVVYTVESAAAGFSVSQAVTATFDHGC
ncbi:hypothetical protein [Kitasatospora sp. GAS204B]|uniref:hypothetical protein n=1 Tax=unclassified Kitasatospora TaxID=2633591 RepID=UPI00247713A1|nr:hypothetical protein [Kitasatospora sp. GAS204B]MDH6121984.1 hypothetical protein [Kitasatospora sp. GAS204B]